VGSIEPILATGLQLFVLSSYILWSVKLRFTVYICMLSVEFTVSSCALIVSVDLIVVLLTLRSYRRVFPAVLGYC